MASKMGLGVVLRTIVAADLRARNILETIEPEAVGDEPYPIAADEDAPEQPMRPQLHEDAASYLRDTAPDEQNDPYFHVLYRANETGAAKDFLEAFIYLGCLDVVQSRKAASSTLARFGSLGGVLAANVEDILKCDGITPKIAFTLSAINHGITCVLREPLKKRTVLTSEQQVLEYLSYSMKHRSVECIRVLFLDRKNGLIKDQVMHEGTIDHVPLYPREVVKRALELGASAIVMAHNHPSGDPTPSQQDVNLTKDIIQALSVFGITLHEHFVIGKEGVERIRQGNYMRF